MLCVLGYDVNEVDLQLWEIPLYLQVDSAVVVLVEDAGGISSESAKTVLNKKDSPSAKIALQKVRLQLQILDKKISDTNSNIQKYV